MRSTGDTSLGALGLSGAPTDWKNQSMRIMIYVLLPTVLLTACANQAPRLYDFDDMEVFSAPYDEVWSVVDKLSKNKEWRLEESNLGSDRAYLTTDWMPDHRNGGD